MGIDTKSAVVARNNYYVYCGLQLAYRPRWALLVEFQYSDILIAIGLRKNYHCADIKQISAPEFLPFQYPSFYDIYAQQVDR
jgi:hypothetical protein